MSLLDEAVVSLRRGSCGAFFIDDTGSPGMADTPRHLHPDRKSWVAVYVNARQIGEVMREFPGALDELEKTIGAKEFHAIDIFQGKKQFESVPFDIRMAYFEFMAFIFQRYNFPILVQTVDPEKNYIEKFRAAFPDGVGPLDLGNHHDLALMLLIIRAKWLLRDEIKESSARLFMDEGRFKAGSSVRIAGLNPPFIEGEILSAQSNYLHPLQLADFAAFAMNRTQLLLGRQSLNVRDQRLLELLSGLVGNFKNVTPVSGRVDQWPPLSPEALLALALGKGGEA